jgi:hypothetical protein
VAVVGRPDPEWGEAVTALVVPAPGAHVDELRLQAFCWERLARFKVPKTIEASRRCRARPRGSCSGASCSVQAHERRGCPQRVTPALGRSAPGWRARAELQRRATMPVSMWMVEAIRPQPGHTVLELGAGLGDTGFLAAELISPGGTLIFLGLRARDALRAPRTGPTELGVRNVRFRQIDAETAIDQPTASVDGALCRWAYMLMADPGVALGETRRVPQARRRWRWPRGPIPPTTRGRGLPAEQANALGTRGAPASGRARAVRVGAEGRVAAALEVPASAKWKSRSSASPTTTPTSTTGGT